MIYAIYVWGNILPARDITYFILALSEFVSQVAQW